MTLYLKTGSGNIDGAFAMLRVRANFEYDDVSLIPRLSAILPSGVSIQGRLSRNLGCELPLIASPMDTVVSPDLSEKLARAGSIPILLPEKKGGVNQLNAEIGRLKALVPGASVGVLLSPNMALSTNAAYAVVKDADVVLLDTLHAAPDKHLDAVKALKDQFPMTDVVSGNVVHPQDVITLIDAGADAIRVGMTSASINDGYSMTGCARSQAAAVFECAKVCEPKGIPLLADGGIRSVGQMAIAFALGADAVMMGKLFAAIKQSAAPFADPGRRFKTYRGMSRSDIIDSDLIAEGKTETIEVTGDFDDVVYKWIDCLKVALSRCGTASLSELRSIVEFEVRELGSDRR